MWAGEKPLCRHPLADGSRNRERLARAQRKKITLSLAPYHHYVAVLAPLVITNDWELAARAPALWQRVRQAQLPEPARDTLSEVFLFWFMDPFKTLTREEVRAMLSFWTAIEESSGYQPIMDEGRMSAKADALTRLLTRRFGPPPDWSGARIAAADIAQLDAWIDGVLDAPGLNELLGPADGPACH